jgi:putative SbcD/Mre11-related phosphoesterase
LTKIKLLPPYPALLLQDKKDRALVVADLHIGWERLLSQKGIHLPSQTPKLKRLLIKLIREIKPTHLLLLGDLKDAITTISMQEWKEIPEFFEDIQLKVPEMQVIIGNHDGKIEPLMPEKTKIVPASGITFGDVGLFHGHAWPAPELLACKTLITGHIHPTVAIRDPMGFRITKQIIVKAQCNSKQLAMKLLKNLRKKTDNIPKTLKEEYSLELEVSQLFILPSLNQFLGGRPINEKRKTKKKTKNYIGPILRSGCINIDKAEVYLLDGTYLGTVEQLKTLI